MNYNYHNAFLKDAKKLPDPIKEEIAALILSIHSAISLADLSNLKKLSGYKSAYRVRIKDYRVGIIVDDGTIILSRVLHRKEIYRYFPK